MTQDEIKKGLEYAARVTGNGVFADAYKIITKQEREIERLKAENDTNMQYIRMMGIQSHIKTSNEQVKQAKLDVLNKVKHLAYYDDNYLDGFVFIDDIDKLIEEVQNEQKD